MNIYLVSCVSQKRSIAVPARDLYTSPLFSKSRAYVERTGETWFILSAKHGLLHPDETVEPYDLTLKRMPKAERRLWADKVAQQFMPHLEGIKTVSFLAGKDYYEFLVPLLRRKDVAISIPMEGLGIGRRLDWLTKELNA